MLFSILIWKSFMSLICPSSMAAACAEQALFQFLATPFFLPLLLSAQLPSVITPWSPLGHNNRILIVWDFFIHLCCLAAFSWGFYRSHWCFWPWTGCDWTHTSTHSNWFDHALCLLLRLTSCAFWLGPSFIWLDVYPSVSHVINPPVLLISPLPSASMWSLSDPLFVWNQLSELPYSSVGTTIRYLLKGRETEYLSPQWSALFFMTTNPPHRFLPQGPEKRTITIYHLRVLTLQLQLFTYYEPMYSISWQCR